MIYYEERHKDRSYRNENILKHNIKTEKNKKETNDRNKQQN